MTGPNRCTAQDQALAQRRRLAKLARHEDLLAHVVDRLRAGRLRLGNASGADGAAPTVLALGAAAPRPGHGRKPRGHRIPQERGIACRPAGAAARDSFGHWEGDLLIFAWDGGPANVTTLLECCSRFVVLPPNPDRRSAGTAERIGAALSGFDMDLRRTVTFNRGFEFMGFPTILP